MLGLTTQQIQYVLYGIAAVVLFWPAIKSAVSKVKLKLPSVPIPWGSKTQPVAGNEHFTPEDVLRFATWLSDRGNTKLAKELAELPTSYYVCPDEVKKLDPVDCNPATEDCDRDPDTDP